MKRIWALFSLALILLLIPAAAFATPQTTIKVQRAPDEVTGVSVLFKNDAVGVCTKTGPNWNWSDSGSYMTDDITGLLLQWSNGQTQLSRSELEIVSEGHGTVVVRIRGCVQPPAACYTVRYEYAGTVPSGAPALPATQSYRAGAEVTVAAAPTLSGYTFSGWTTSDAAVSGGKLTMPAKNVVLKGSFREIPAACYTVRYEYAGTVPPGAPALPATQSYRAGAEVTVAAAQTLSGYTFSGWTTSDAVISGGKLTMPAKNVVLKGSFARQHIVRYVYTGDVPASAPAAPGDETHIAGDTVTVAAEPTLDEYDFSGWTTDDAPIAGGQFSMPEGNVVLNGSFKPKPKYTVTYAYTGTVPSGAPALPATQSYKAGAEVTVAAAPTLSGYTFSGWTTSDAAVSGGKFTMPAKNVSITGSFTEIPPTLYTVTYAYTGTVPSGAPALPATQSYKAGAEVTVAAAPTLSGYTFTGWTTSDATVSGGKFTMPAKDVTISGSFAELYVVSYQYTGSIPSGAPALPSGESYTAGTLVSVKAAPTLSGYTFTGWTTSDATVSGGTFLMPEKAVVLSGSFAKNYTPPVDHTPNTDASTLQAAQYGAAGTAALLLGARLLCGCLRKRKER
ncbi:MAG: InlB B-repeat-containing protein [Oscillospiraceae bacterium]|nr:InlB B-repeat-containing protein [Oscillospiraceae bacterium]